MEQLCGPRDEAFQGSLILEESLDRVPFSSCHLAAVTWLWNLAGCGLLLQSEATVLSLGWFLVRLQAWVAVQQFGNCDPQRPHQGSLCFALSLLTHSWGTVW